MLLSNRVHLPTIFLSYSWTPKQKKIPSQYSVFKKHLYIMYYNPSLGTEPTGEKNSLNSIPSLVKGGSARRIRRDQTRRERTRKRKHSPNKKRKNEEEQNVATTNKYWCKMPNCSSNSVTEQARCPDVQVAARNRFL